MVLCVSQAAATWMVWMLLFQAAVIMQVRIMHLPLLYMCSVLANAVTHKAGISGMVYATRDMFPWWYSTGMIAENEPRYNGYVCCYVCYVPTQW
jgi:hypothetical protein